MTAGSPPDNDPREHLPNLPGDWQLDAFPEEQPGGGDRESGVGSQESELPVSSPTPDSRLLTPEPTLGSRLPTPEVPPSPEQIVEAMLFVGGHALTAEAACSAVRGLTPDRFLAAVDSLTRRYRSQRRPYSVEPRDGGFVLAITPAHRGLRERLFGGPRETRLAQPALDVLSVVAYRQPVGKGEVDAVRGTDSGGTLRQLVRLGLVAVQHRAEAGSREVRYGTTPRFLKVFGLTSLDELPRLGDTTQV